MKKLVAPIVLLIISMGAAAQAWAQYPTKPIRLIVPAAPGGGTDITARSFVPALGSEMRRRSMRKPSVRR